MRKQLENLKQWLDEREFDFENRYGISQMDFDKVTHDKKDVYFELNGIYEEGI